MALIFCCIGIVIIYELYLSSVQAVTVDRVDVRGEGGGQKLVSGLIGALGTGQGENESGVN